MLSMMIVLTTFSTVSSHFCVHGGSSSGSLCAVSMAAKEKLGSSWLLSVYTPLKTFLLPYLHGFVFFFVTRTCHDNYMPE